MEKIDNLFAISPIDGRYRKITEEISQYFSEFAYIKYRVFVEIDWLDFLLRMDEINIDIDKYNYKEIFGRIKNEFNIEEAKKVKEIEKKTNHDVKAIEYYIREKLKDENLEKKICPFVHFACTSEDINNIAYGMMINDFLSNIFIVQAENLINQVDIEAKKLKNIPMIGHTHGQNATPTTVGKELEVFCYRWKYVLELIKNIKLKGKFSGAVGNFNSHYIAYPNIDWLSKCREFVESEGLEFNPLTTQIESHDVICTLFSYVKLFNNITMDFNSDMWIYISKGYFKQKVSNNQEVGSSIMPHKVNPINHENSMANIRLSNSILGSFIDNLQISRMQRDLSDSSMLRNIGVGFSHAIISINQTSKGFEKMNVNMQKLIDDLNESPEVLAEAIQTVLRKNGYNDAYEKLKELTRGKEVTLDSIYEFINSLDIDENDRKRLLDLSPEKYIGIADKLCSEI